MLRKKMAREILKNKGQFLSIMILAFLAVSLFASMKASNISAYNKLNDLYEKTNTADGWIFGEKFEEKDVENIKKIKSVKDARRRIHISANAKENDQAQLEVYIQEDNVISKPYVVKGKEFDAEKTDMIWLSESFADAWDIQLGDNFTFMLSGTPVTKKVAGFVISPEYQYLKAGKDLDIVKKNISIVYVSANSREFNEFPYTEIIFTSDAKDIKKLEQDISDVLNGNYAVLCDKDDMPGIKVMADELAQHDQFAVSFPVIFIIIALLVIATTMKRMIEQQRTQIGTLRALGMKKNKIIIHYISYSFVVSLIGTVIGIYVGTNVFGEAIAKIFRDWYQIPGWTVEMDESFIYVSTVVVLTCTLATYISCRKVMNIHPAESLRPATPKAGKNTIFEKMPFWNRLGFSVRYNLRDISRGKLRAVMGVFGTAAGMMMMVAALASYSTIGNAESWTFDKLQNFKTQVDFDTKTSSEEAQRLREKYDGELVQMSGIELSKSKKIKSEKKRSTTLIVTEGIGYFALTDVKQNVVKIPEGTIAVTMKLAKALDIEKGDTVYWHLYEKNTWYEAKVGLINRNPSFSGVTMLRKDFEKYGIDFRPSVLYTNEKLTKAEDDIILGVHDDKDLRESFDVMMSMLTAMLAVFVIFAAILPIVVLYNCGNLSFNERVKEFATLKVLGFHTKRIRKLLSLQNLWMSLIGILAGAPFGTVILQYMFDSNGDSMDYQVVANPLSYIVSAVFVLLVSLFVSYMFNRKIKQLDMVETLKGIE